MKYIEICDIDSLCFSSYKTMNVVQLKVVTSSNYCNMYVYISVRHLFTLVMRRITTFRSTTDRIHNNGPIKLKYYNTFRCFTNAYSIQYSNMLYLPEGITTLT
jgi:hypothetical protein